MKTIVFAFFFTALSLNLYSQQFSSNEVAVGDFVKRMYDQKPFKGVRIIQDSSTNYLISVVVYQINTFENEHLLNRTATLQARSNAGLFVKEAAITSETIINTSGKAVSDSGKTKTEMVDFVKKVREEWGLWMDLLTSFDVLEGKERVFVYINKF